MVKHIDFGSIEQFRQTVKAVTCKARYIGKDENGEAIYDPSLPLPTITFEGTVKLHGSQGCVSYSLQDGLWVQSRNRIIEVGKDNAGFAAFVHARRNLFSGFLSTVATSKDEVVSIFGEWAGRGLQSGVAINNIEKSFFIFALRVNDNYLPVTWDAPEHRIYNIRNFPTYSIDIDFNYPELAQNKLSELTEAVGTECPVAKAFGFSGTGEGIVWVGQHNGQTYRFKVKDERHSVTKVKTLAAVDVELVESIRGFVEYAVTPQRIEQAISEVGSDDQSKIGDILRWVVKDIWKEETDTLVANGLADEPGKVNKAISNKARELYFARTT